MITLQQKWERLIRRLERRVGRSKLYLKTAENFLKRHEDIYGAVNAKIQNRRGDK